MPDISIRQLIPEDWEILRDMRLLAVEMHKNYFGSSSESVKKVSPSEWQNRLSQTDRAFFGLFDGDQLIGITAVFRDDDEPKTRGRLAYSFIEPAYRGQGLPDLFYKARIDWALKNTQWTSIVTGHRKDNVQSRGAILRNGFTFTHEEIVDWPDGTRDIECKYKLNLQDLNN